MCESCKRDKTEKFQNLRKILINDPSLCYKNAPLKSHDSEFFFSFLTEILKRGQQ